MSNGNRVENTVNNVIWGNILTCVCSIMPFILRTLIIRLWGLDYLGINSLFAAILQVLNIAELGIGQAIAVNLYKPAADRNIERINLLLSIYKYFYRLIALAVLVIGFVLVPFLPLLINGECPSEINVYVVYFVYVLQVLLDYLVFPYSSAAFTANQNSYVYNRSKAFAWFVSYVLQIIAVCVCKSYYVYIFLLLLAPALAGVLGRVLLYKYYPEYKVSKIHMTEIPKDFLGGFFKRVSAMALSKVRVSLRGSIDTIIISAYIGIVAVAKYQNYMLVVAVPVMLIASIKDGIIPSLGNSMATESVGHNLDVTEQVYFIIHWVATVFAAFLLCFYQPFMKLWAGNEALLSETAVILFTIYFYWRAITEVNILIRTTSGVWWEGKWIALVESGVNLILNVAFVRVTGIEGVLLATILSILLINIPFETFYVYKYCFKKKSGGVLLGYLKDSLITFIAVGVTYVITKFYYHGMIVTLIIWGITCMLIPNAVLLVFHMKNPRLRDAWRLLKQIAKSVGNSKTHRKDSGIWEK